MVDKEKRFMSAVIYIHNTEQTLEKFLKTIIVAIENNFESSEIICVNDESMDNSIQIIKDISKQTKTASLSILNMSYFHGLELAMNAGVDLAIGDFVFEFDKPSLDFDSEEIMKIYRRALDGYDIVSAVPDKKEKFFSHLFYTVFDKYTNLTYEMHTESFRILSRRVINRISSMNKVNPYRKAIYASQGLRVDHVLYHSRESMGGASHDKQTRIYKLNLAVDSLILFTEVGYRFSMYMTILMMLVSLLMTIYTFVIYMTVHPVAGWTTTILFLSVVFFGLFAILTVIIKYLQIIVDLVFKRKHYSFESIEKLTK